MTTETYTSETELDQFTEYCNIFYSYEDGIYPIATPEEINRAISLYFVELLNEQPDGKTWGYGDSLDRERVRAIIERKN